VPHIGRVKLARPKEYSQIVLLASMSSFNMANTYSTIEIKKKIIKK